MKMHFLVFNFMLLFASHLHGSEDLVIPFMGKDVVFKRDPVMGFTFTPNGNIDLKGLFIPGCDLRWSAREMSRGILSVEKVSGRLNTSFENDLSSMFRNDFFFCDASQMYSEAHCIALMELLWSAFDRIFFSCAFRCCIKPGYIKILRTFITQNLCNPEQIVAQIVALNKKSSLGIKLTTVTPSLMAAAEAAKTRLLKKCGV